MQVMPGLWTMWTTPLCHMTQTNHCGEDRTFSHDSESTVSPSSKKFRAKNGLVHFPDDGPFTRSLRLTFGRRARTKTCRNRDAPGHLSISTGRYRGPCQIDQVQHQTLGPGLLPSVTAPSPLAPSAYSPPESIIHAQVRQLLARTSCDGGCACVGKGEHNRIGHFILDQFVELFFCIYDLDASERGCDVFCAKCEGAPHELDPQKVWRCVCESVIVSRSVAPLRLTRCLPDGYQRDSLDIGPEEEERQGVQTKSATNL